MPGGSEATEGAGRLAPEPRPVRLGALRHRDFRLFWIGQLVSQIGTWMQSVAQAWLVLELTQSPLQHTTEEHTSELQSQLHLPSRPLRAKKNPAARAPPATRRPKT